jgi:putative peptidoglycan lipid II flippase
LSSLKKNIGWTTVLSTVGFLLTFASQIIVSYFFGTSAQLDAYWIAFALLNFLTFPLASLKESLVPMVHRYAAHDLLKSSLYFSKGLTLILMVASLGAAIALLDARQLTTMMVGDVSDETYDLIIHQLYWLTPAIWLLAISETLNTLLSSFNKAIFQTISRVLAAATALIFIGTLSGWIGIYALPISFSLGQLMMSIVLIYSFLKLKLSFKPSWPSGLGRDYFYLSLMLLVSAFFSQLYSLYEKNVFVGFGSGIISSFQYGVALTNVIVAILVVSFANVFWPRFMEYVKQEDWDALSKELSLAIKLSLLGLGCFCSFVYIYAEPVVNIVFVRGAFNQEAAIRTVEMLRATIFTALPIAAIILIGRVLISLKSAKSIMLVGLVVAVSGSCVLKISQYLNSPEIAIHHWLFANIIGFMLSAFFFTKLCRLDISSYISSFWWSTRFLFCLGIIYVIATFLSEIFCLGCVKFLGLTMSAIVFGIFYIFIIWIFQLIPPLNSLRFFRK